MFDPHKRAKPHKESDLKELAEKLNWKGKGTEDDPFIINDPNPLPKEFLITYSELFIVIENCKWFGLGLLGVKNLKINNCIIRNLYLEYCSTLVLEQVKVKSLVMKNCTEIVCLSCYLSEVELKLSTWNAFSNCILLRIYEDEFSGHNVFEKYGKFQNIDNLNPVKIRKNMLMCALIMTALMIFKTIVINIILDLL